MTVASIQIDRPVPAKMYRASGHLRIVSDRTPQNAHRDTMRGDDDNARFANVVLPHLGDAYALARWITGSRADAEDVVQDACLRAFRGIAGFGEGNARAWVLTIVRHTAYSWLGKNRPATLVVTNDVEGIEGAEIASGDA